VVSLFVIRPSGAQTSSAAATPTAIASKPLHAIDVEKVCSLQFSWTGTSDIGDIYFCNINSN